MSSSGGGSKDHDLEALRLSQEEARTVLDHQIAAFSRIDDKAARTFRLNGLLLGLILTAVSFIVPSQTLEIGAVVNNWTIGGVALIIVSFILAVTTYTVTDAETGLGTSDIQRLIKERYTEEEWLILLLRSEAAWMKENTRRQNYNGILLTSSHIALILAIISFSAGIALPLL